jgi:hypothetical protein
MFEKAEHEVHSGLMVEHFLDEPKLHDHGSIRTTVNDREMMSLQKMVMNYPDVLSVGE